LNFDAENITIGEYLARYLEDVQSRVRPKTFRRYQDLAKCHLSLTLGRVKLKDLRPNHLRTLYRQRLDAGLSARTVGHAHTLIKQVLTQAVRDGLLPRNPAEAVKPPRATK
jgi:integrase